MDPDKPVNASALISSGQWFDKISNHNQLGGIETSVVDNGPGKGSRIAWFNTGSGLRFKVVLDRAMDIADAFYNRHSLAWISHMGVTPPNPSAVAGVNWLNSFAGGLLTTCGLTHIGGPEKDEYGEKGLHDRISHMPATIESIMQPDLKHDIPEMSLTGRMIQSSTFGPHLELRRTISARLGESTIFIHDEVTNLGNSPAPHMLLYHCNFGWPLIDEGTEIIWEGDLEVPNDQSRKIFNPDTDYKICSPPLEDHRNYGEAVGFIDILPDSDGVCECGVLNTAIGLEINMKFYKRQLSWLTNWQHWGKNEYVMALEPCTNPPIGQSAARKNNTLLMIEPGDTKTYDLELTVN